MEEVAGQVDQWVALGDSVGLYPYVNEVLDWQRKNKVFYILGDHESALLNKNSLINSYTGTESIIKQIQAISDQNLETISQLNNTYDIQIDNLKICATHFLSPESSESKGKYAIDLLIQEKQYEDYDFVLFGHTHLPTVLYGRRTIFINPGSAGFPIDASRQCSMVLLDTVSKGFNLIRFNYDGEELIRAIKSSGYNKKLISYINNGHRWD
jgi:predicted phosphodiesterase